MVSKKTELESNYIHFSYICLAFNHKSGALFARVNESHPNSFKVSIRCSLNSLIWGLQTSNWYNENFWYDDLNFDAIFQTKLFTKTCRLRLKVALAN